MQLPHTLSEKESNFLQYNIKCSGEHDTTWNIPCTFTFPPLHFMLYRGKYIFFGTVCLTYKSVKIWNKLIFEDIIMSATDTFQILLYPSAATQIQRHFSKIFCSALLAKIRPDSRPQRKIAKKVGYPRKLNTKIYYKVDWTLSLKIKYISKKYKNKLISLLAI